MLRNKETGATMEIVSSMIGRDIMNGETRDVMNFIIEDTYDNIIAFFVKDMQYEDVQYIYEAILPDPTEENPNPEPVAEEREVINDLSAYCMPGIIIDHRDGKFTVMMGAKTPNEKRIEELEASEAALNILLGGE